MLGTAVNRLLAAVLLGAVGRVLLLKAPPLVEGLVLRLDETVSLFAGMALGGPWGAVAALTATLGTPSSFSGMWALEAWIVGSAVRAGAVPVLAVAAYWLVIYAAFVSGSLVAPGLGIDVRLMLSKQLVNATLSAALAQMLVATPLVRRLFHATLPAQEAPPFRTQIARAIIPLSTIPSILLGLGLGTMYARELVRDGTQDLTARATSSATWLGDYVAAADGDVATLAGALTERAGGVEEIRRALALHHAGSTAFVTMIATDGAGAVLAGSSRLTSDTPQPTPPLPPVGDRPYFTEPATTGRRHLSDGFPGRGFMQAPIVVLSAPYAVAGRFAGVAQGSLNLEALSRGLSQFMPDADASIVVLDRRGQVIASTGPVRVPLLVDGRTLPWVQATATAATAEFTEPVPDQPNARNVTHVAVRRDIASLGWQVHVRRPIATMQAPLVPFYMLTAAWLLICIVIATPLADQVARRITQPLELLAHAAETIGRGQPVAQPALPASAPAEVRSLQRELEAMVRRLDESVALLDRKVRERSAELAATTSRTEQERAQLEARLRQSQKMEAIGTLAGGIAHDFNNILALITGSSELALGDLAPDAPARPFVAQTLKAAQRAEGLVRQILTFSRRRDDLREVVALAPIVREVGEMLRSTLPAMIDIHTTIAADLPPVHADPVQVHQILMNLATNAAHAMRDGGGALTLTAERHAGADVCLTVADTGAGMDAQTLERAFEPFFTTKPVGSGTGLGLSVVHGIVTAHGGTIDVTSRPGVGTTFRIVLPGAMAEAPPVATTPLADRAPGVARGHVLVVDDERELATLVCRQLQRLGFTAETRGDAVDAVARLEANDPPVDLVLSDLAMPKMTGLELAEVVRAAHPDVAFVLCSGRVTEEDRQRAAHAGVTEILGKPFTRQQLAAAMERALAARLRAAGRRG